MVPNKDKIAFLQKTAFSKFRNLIYKLYCTY